MINYKIIKYKEFKIYLMILILLVLLLFRFLNEDLKLEKPDEDFTWFNISNIHIEGISSVEKHSKSEIELNFFTSNNFYKLNYYIIYSYDCIIKNIDDCINLKKYGFRELNNKKTTEFNFWLNWFRVINYKKGLDKKNIKRYI